MKNEELKEALTLRRTDLGMSYRDLQGSTKLGYNTVRRVFSKPMDCHFTSLLKVAHCLGCDLIFAVEDRIGDELEE